MTTNHEAAVAEFREASAAVRRAHSARDEAREVQIIADRRYGEASVALAAAQDRLSLADAALQTVRADAPTPPDIDTVTRTFGTEFRNVFRGLQANPQSFANGVADAPAETDPAA